MLVKSILKATSIIEYLSRADSTGRSFSEVATDLEMSKATTHRFLQTLLITGLIKRDQLTGRYTLGLRLLEFGSAASNQIELRREMRPFLKELMERTGETSNFALIDDEGVVFVDNVESPQGIRSFSRIGRHACIYATALGKVMLAFLPTEAAERYLAKLDFHSYTPKTITSVEGLKEELVRIREVGYGIDDEEFEIGARCVAAPVLDQDGYVVAVLSISGPSSRITDDNMRNIAAIVKDVADRASGLANFSVGNRLMRPQDS